MAATWQDSTRGAARWKVCPFVIVSLRDVLRLDAANLFAAAGYLSGSIAEWQRMVTLLNGGGYFPPEMSIEHRAHFLKSLERIRDASREMEMVASAAAATRAFDDCLERMSSRTRFDVADLQFLISHGDRVVHAFGDELRARLVFTVPGKHARYYDQSSPFGEKVDDAFPSAIRDIEEAGKCRALGRWTASVMHLMRALEVALEALANHHGVPAGENWNKVLNEVEASLRSTSRKTDGPEAEQWAAEAGTHLRFIKNAWRNHAMHPRATYDEEQAVAIYDNARSFMRHLAEQVAE